MPDINENDYQYAEDLPVEDHTSLDGSEKFVMFDGESGKQLELNELIAYIGLPTPPLENGTYILKATISNGTPTYSWVTE